MIPRTIQINLEMYFDGILIISMSSGKSQFISSLYWHNLRNITQIKYILIQQINQLLSTNYNIVVMFSKLHRSLLTRFLFSVEPKLNTNTTTLSTSEFPKPPKIFKHLEYNPWQAIHLVKVHSLAGFEETVDLVVRINVNPKNGEQIVRGSAVMPSGTGKQISVAVLVSEQYRDACKASGADIVDPQQIIKQVKANKIEFDKLFTTPQLLPDLKQFAKVLGPQGLMPNLKVGTLITRDKIAEAIKVAKAGQVTFRVDSGKNIHVPLGKVSFTQNQLLDNLQSLMKTLSDKKPAAVKGKYFLEAYLKSTMGPRWKLKIEYVDPKHRLYILDVR